MEIRDSKCFYKWLYLLAMALLYLPYPCEAKSNFSQNNHIKPIYSYLNDPNHLSPVKTILAGPARVLSLDSKEGLHCTSINSHLKLFKHNLNENKGSLSIWFFALEDLSTASRERNMAMHNANYRFYPFIADYHHPKNFHKANFAFVWGNRHHRNLIAKFFKGEILWDAYQYRNGQYQQGAFVATDHTHFYKNKWYQLVLTWDKIKDHYRLYMNGVQVGAENQHHSPAFYKETCGDTLYVGSPAFCFASINFFMNLLSPDQVNALYHKEATNPDRRLDQEIAYMYKGIGRKSFDFEPDSTWQIELDLSLTDQDHLDAFYVQGNPIDVKITDEGLLVETIDNFLHKTRLDSQVYLWTLEPFEGDLYIEYEFNSLRPGGLSLLMAQASGMNREDFMADYPWRTSGKMSMVGWQDVRNYHWEYYREMADVRNDVMCSALMKNPYHHPLAYGCVDHPIEKYQWHKLQFLQCGNKIIGAIDGVIMIEAMDNSFTNNGPVYNFGRIAIRCMLKTKMKFRNFKVYNRLQGFHVERIYAKDE